MHWRLSIYHVVNIQVERYKWERIWEVYESRFSVYRASAQSLRREPKVPSGCIPDHGQLF